MSVERRGPVVNMLQMRGGSRLRTSITETGNQSPALAQLLEKLGRKAKLEPKFKFYTLYSHLLRWDVLLAAWKEVKRNGGASGYDNVTIQDIEKNGVQRFELSIGR